MGKPPALVIGNCVYHVAHQGVMQAISQMGQNQEMTNYTSRRRSSSWP